MNWLVWFGWYVGLWQNFSPLVLVTFSLYRRESLWLCPFSRSFEWETFVCVCVCVFGKGRWGGSSNFVGIARGAFTIVFCPSRFSHSNCYHSCWLDVSLSWLRNCIVFLMSLQLWNCGVSLIWHVWPFVLSLNMRFFQLQFSLKITFSMSVICEVLIIVNELSFYLVIVHCMS